MTTSRLRDGFVRWCPREPQPSRVIQSLEPGLQDTATGHPDTRAHREPAHDRFRSEQVPDLSPGYAKIRSANSRLTSYGSQWRAKQADARCYL